MNDLIDPKNPSDIKVIMDDCLSDYQKGYRAFKIKIGRGYRWMNHDCGLTRILK